MNRRIGIMGGTFDPIHYGHLVLAEEVRQVLSLDEILFIPAGIPPHKANSGVTDSEIRLQMVATAIADNQAFSLSRMEIDAPGKSYTVHTLRALKDLYGETVQLYFITGADTLLDLRNWFAAEEVLKLCTFVGATRPGYLPGEVELEALRLRTEQQANIELMPIPGLAISSTEIRERVKAGRTIRYLVPEGVERLIREAHLYE